MREEETVIFTGVMVPHEKTIGPELVVWAYGGIFAAAGEDKTTGQVFGYVGFPRVFCGWYGRRYIRTEHHTMHAMRPDFGAEEDTWPPAREATWLGFPVPYGRAVDTVNAVAEELFTKGEREW